MNIHYLRSIIGIVFAMTSRELTGCHFGTQLRVVGHMDCLRYPTTQRSVRQKQSTGTCNQNKLLLIGGVDPFCISGKELSRMTHIVRKFVEE